MSIKSEEQYLKGLIKLTSALVLGLGLILSFNLLIVSAPTREDRDSEPISRDPAGLLTPQKVGASIEDVQERMQTLAISCYSNKNEPKKVTAKLLRITGRDCNDSQSFQVVNQSNGISAIVFQTGSTAFTTDYISLEKGINKITISRLGNNGSNFTREMIVHRE